MEVENIVDVVKVISKERLLSYKFDANDNITTILKRYLFNVQVSESFYPLISALEIALRNNLFNAVSNLKGNNWLFDETLSENILSKIKPCILYRMNMQKYLNQHSDLKK